VAGPAWLDDGLTVGDETGTEVAEGVGDDLAAAPLQAVATNVTTTNRAAKPIRMGKSCLIAPTPHPR
jgi:hypothetical protein